MRLVWFIISWDVKGVMSRAKLVYENHILYLREISNERNHSFEITLRTAMKGTEGKNYLLADFLGGNEKEIEKRLIEFYRLEFYEWLANLALDFDNSKIEKMAENKARSIVSETGKKGGAAKKAKYLPLKELAKKLCNEKNFKSRRNAAITIMPEIIAESKRLGIALSTNQAENTITKWLKEMGLPANI